MVLSDGDLRRYAEDCSIRVIMPLNRWMLTAQNGSCATKSPAQHTVHFGLGCVTDQRDTYFYYKSRCQDQVVYASN